MAKILVVGSSNTDFVVKMDRFPDLGETILGVDYQIVQGGKGANQAVAAARLGGEVTFVCRVGNDGAGRDALESYRKDGLDLRYARISEHGKTGTAFVMVNNRGQNLLMVASGANMDLSRADIDGAQPAFEAADVVLFQLENPLDTVMYGINKAVSLNKKTILNPAPAKQLPDSALKGLFSLTPNETEARQLTGIPVDTVSDAVKAGGYFLGKGVLHPIITLGSQGAVWVHADGHLHVPAPVVHAVDTTAAGDVFNGALAVAIAEGTSLPDAIGFAIRAASLSVTRMGAQPSIPRKEEVGGKCES